MYTGFACWVYRNYGKEKCTSHYISWKALYQIVLDNIRQQAEAAKQSESKYIEMLVKLKTDKKKKDNQKNEKNLKQIERRLKEISAILKHMYEDMALGKISEERYQEMYSDFNDEEKELKIKRKNLKEKLEKSRGIFQSVEKFMPLIKKYTDIQELNAYILNELIEKIVVHEKTIGEDGKKTQKVEIYYKFVGTVEMEG